MLDALAGARHIGTLLAKRKRVLDISENHVAAHSGGQVQDNVDLGIADPLRHLTIKRDVAARCARLGVTDMAVNDRSAGLRRVNRRFRDLLRRTRNVWAAVLSAT